ncbi:MAG: aryl-sulfate sulfotransferase [Bacteroidota bacterium]
MIRILLTSLFIFSMVAAGLAQKTVGLLSYDPSRSYDGYNVIYPHNQPNVYLLDNCGEIVHIWTDEANFRPGNMAYIQPDGRLIKTKRDAVIINDPIWAGGGGAIVEIRDWDNNLEWQYELNDSLARLHHDIAVKPNGNILMIAWEFKSREESIAAGRDSTNLPEDELWPDYILEINPDNDEVVWEWHAWDHLIQDFDSTKANYGVVADHPEKIDINWDTSDGDPDWMHSNALNYNPELEQIILCVPTFHEMWIIDNSTTTEQAAGSVGGRSGIGGDLMFRWGNPAAYDKGTVEDQKLFYPHDAHWALDFLDFGDPNRGKLVIYNNRFTSTVSTANIFTPQWDMYSWGYNQDANGVFFPNDFDEVIVHPVDSTLMHSTGLSSIQLLPNGNKLICVGRFGYSFELTPDNEIVWEYKTPIRMGQPATQGDTLLINNNLTFRMDRYPTNFSAFDNRDLSPLGWIEQNPDTAFCDLILSTEVIPQRKRLTMRPNPANTMVALEWEGQKQSVIRVFDLHGRLLESFQASGGMKYLDTSSWNPGMYLLQVDDGVMEKLVVLHN